MGGFKLYGPAHVFEDNAEDSCYCMGFMADIENATETRLLMKNPKMLDPYTDLPVELRSDFLRSHMPAVLSYRTRSLTPEDRRQRIENEKGKSKATTTVTAMAGFDPVGDFGYARFTP